MNQEKKARVIAFYLPQFHPIPENDEWWGKGFTEWTNVGKAKPLYSGHYQPKVPADLGYYDLRMPQVRQAQADLATEAGVEGFMYWHYWFGNGKRLMADIFDDVLNSGKPDFPFCLGWANHSWYSKNWNASSSKKDVLLIEQKYPGLKDYEDHFYLVLKAFKDSRYITVDGKALFMIYAPNDIPDLKLLIQTWRKLAAKENLKGIHFVGQIKSAEKYNELIEAGFDAVYRSGMEEAVKKIRGRVLNSIMFRLTKNNKTPILNKIKYQTLLDNLYIEDFDSKENVYPAVIPNYDHSPRSGNFGIIFDDSTPDLFRKMLNKAIAIISKKRNENKIVFLRSWNEWAEGNYVEPDLKFGKKYLDAIKSEVNK
jgi:Glycosyltransferase WbsX